MLYSKKQRKQLAEDWLYFSEQSQSLECKAEYLAYHDMYKNWYPVVDRTQPMRKLERDGTAG